MYEEDLTERRLRYSFAGNWGGSQPTRNARNPEKALAEAEALSGLSVPLDRESGPPVRWRSGGAEALSFPDPGEPVSVDGKVRNATPAVKP